MTTIKYCFPKRKKSDMPLDKNSGVSLQSIYNDVLTGKLDSSVLNEKYMYKPNESDQVGYLDNNMSVPLERYPDTDINVAWEHSMNAKKSLSDYSENLVKDNQTHAYNKKLIDKSKSKK